MTRRLRGVSGPLANEVFILRGHTMLGRSGDADIQVLDKGISRRHSCLVVSDTGTLVLMDLASSNGTFVGTERITSRPLQPGESFRIGDSTFRYEDVAESDPDFRYEEPSEAVNLLSGPAQESTSVISSDALIPTSVEACADPLHTTARRNGWMHCPACGAKA